MPVFPADHVLRRIGALSLACLLFSAALPAFAQEAADDSVGETSEEAATPAAEPAPQPVPPAPPADNSVVRENHGAWSMVCDQPPGSSVEQCALMQNVIADDRPCVPREHMLRTALVLDARRPRPLVRAADVLGHIRAMGLA